ncbi:MAG TPA: radical SAM protein [Candidatus Bathyarchaeota archaeon]|nr:radical SAM protein [Candidatus Bathyarchaeota archaeon]
MRVLLVEPPKEVWFVMGEYLPPPFGLLELGAYLEKHVEDVEVTVLDCQAERVDWQGLEKRIAELEPDVVASSGFATCNAYTAVRTLETAKKVNPNILTVTGGQHFTALAEESLREYPEIDVIVRGEGEVTFAELVKAFRNRKPFSEVAGISFRHKGKIYRNDDRAFIKDLDSLPFPAYHLVEHLARRYHFRMMAGSKRYAIIEGSRGCPHRCVFCSQWIHWRGEWRRKTAKRIADEIEFLFNEYGMEFFWLTDDNFGLGKLAEELCDEIIRRDLGERIMWFMQARCDDVAKNSKLLPKLRKAGNYWILLGVESPNKRALEAFKKGITPEDARKAVKLLKQNDIFAQTTLIIGERSDSHKSISQLRTFVNDLDPDLAIFMILTPFPGTILYKEALKNGWIEDFNWANYDMVHAVMPTEHLSREEVQEELYKCYRSFYGSLPRRLKGLFSKNKLKRKTYRYLASQAVLQGFRKALSWRKKQK